MNNKPTYEALEARVRELEKALSDHRASGRRAAGEAVGTTDREWKELLARLPIGVYRNTPGPTGRFIMANDAIARMFGYASPEEFMQTRVSGLYMDPADRERFSRQLLARGGVSAAILRLKKKDGSAFSASVTAGAIRNAQGKIEHFDGIIEDITERLQTESALRESEDKYRSLFNQSVAGIYLHDLDGRFLDANQTACIQTGYSKTELLGLTVFDLHPKAADSNQNFPKVEILRQWRQWPPGKRIRLEAEHQRKDGTVFPVDISTGVVRYGDRTFILAITQDITERKRAEAEREKLQVQLTQAKKMEAIGVLAGGIAHNFNNILMGVQGRTSLMLMNKEPSDPDYEHLRGIEEYVRNAVELTKDLLGFARGGKYQVKPTDLNALIEKSLRAFGSAKKEIRIHVKFGKDPWTAEVDKGQIQQALLNLYVNAWQAMPGGGELYVQTENVVIDKPLATPFQIPPGAYVKISVTDTGVGMDAATREKIFEPFFSTKKTGQGYGLGLASVYGVIKNHGGFINVYSEKGHGAAFTIYLPASERAPAQERPAPELDIRRGQGTILLVDDESMIIEVGQAMLEKLGYRALTAGNGREALHLYEKQKAEIDLVILDMIMPGMGGGETYDRLKRIDGGVKVILSSGYSLAGEAQEIMDRGCDGFIQKPFTMEKLSLKVREAMDAG